MCKLLISGTTAMVLGLVGCAQPAPLIYTENGQQGYAIACSGDSQDWNACFVQAGALCKGRGYEVANKVEERSTNVFYAAFAIPNVKRTMVVVCKQ